LSISPEDVKRSLLNVNRVVSMDTPLKSSEDESNSLYDVIENKKIPKPDKKLMDDSLKREIERVLDTLNPREAEILKMYYGLLDQKQKTLEEISQYIGLTKERIRQIKERAIQKLKSSSRNKLLKKYL
jgi:RNA polymerase primary sigma factor